jgi:hypothetical protein
VLALSSGLVPCEHPSNAPKTSHPRGRTQGHACTTQLMHKGVSSRHTPVEPSHGPIEPQRAAPDPRSMKQKVCDGNCPHVDIVPPLASPPSATPPPPPTPPNQPPRIPSTRPAPLPTLPPSKGRRRTTNDGVPSRGTLLFCFLRSARPTIGVIPATRPPPRLPTSDATANPTANQPLGHGQPNHPKTHPTNSPHACPTQ